MREQRTTGWLPPGGPPGPHPLITCMEALEQALPVDDSVGCWGLSDREVTDLIGRVHRAAAALEALRLRLVAEADRRTLSTGPGLPATSTAGWLSAALRMDRRTAGSQVRLATELDARFGLVRRRLAEGRVDLDQARVIVSALARLAATGASPVQCADAEAWLLDQAETFGPEDLRVLGRRVFEVIDPDAADAVEGRLLEDEERRARARARMWIRRVGDGCTRGGFQLPDAQADMLRAALDALISPRRPSIAVPDGRAEPLDDSGLEGRRLPYDQRLGQAFCELVEHLPVDALPQSGRSTPTLTVVIDVDALESGLGAATLSSGSRMSAAEARRLACNAGLVPLVLGGASVPLDLGREQRFHTAHQRAALGALQRGCVADGCDRGPSWCELHHPTPWSEGGRTNATGPEAGVLLCARHHHLVHSGGWTVVHAADNVPELVPPTRIDPLRRPVRHRRFRRRRPEP